DEDFEQFRSIRHEGPQGRSKSMAAGLGDHIAARLERVDEGIQARARPANRLEEVGRGHPLRVGGESFEDGQRPLRGRHPMRLIHTRHTGPAYRTVQVSGHMSINMDTRPSNRRDYALS